MTAVYIVGGVRTPVGKTGGTLRNVLPEELGAMVLNELLARFNLTPKDIDQVIMGNAVGPGGNIARVCVLAAGWPYQIPALTVDSQCGSGLSAINLAVDLIKAGAAELIIAGGVESTSLAPRRQFNPTDPRFKGADVFYERAPFSTPAIGDPEPGIAAERLAEQLGIGREDMDRLALASHRRASHAQAQGVLADILVPVWNGRQLIDFDECIRDDMSLRLLARMKPAFLAGGKITAGNTC